MSSSSRYATSGVDEPREQAALAKMLASFARTQGLRTGIGSVVAEEDSFASLIRVGENLGLAIATDGVGTKLLIARELGSYREIAIDLVANNVNDILCTGAAPVALVDYIGIDVADETFLLEFASGLSDAAIEAQTAIVGGEIAQIGEMLNPDHGSPRFDVVATAIGLCSLGDTSSDHWPRALDRRNVKPGDVLVALESSGLHSNGYSLARDVLFSRQDLSIHDTPLELGGKSVGETLITPTKIYVSLILPLLKKRLVNGLANISGGGFLTIARLNPALGFQITRSLKVPPIFQLIEEKGRLTAAEMFSTFNMGIGMVLAVSPENVPEVTSILAEQSETAIMLGQVTAFDTPGEILIPGLRLRGRGHVFEQLS